ncbi:MAG: hypothetical protein LH472_07560, partial [Pyrinomonadaceae bacterium]|nr:hypothetical protein [Pyrinomonadaceae bacterium]
AIIRLIEKGEFGNNGQEADDSLKEQLGALSFTADAFDEYSVREKGVTIIYDAGFPHVIQAAQPNGHYLFTWAELKPFIRRDGLLGQFIH